MQEPAPTTPEATATIPEMTETGYPIPTASPAAVFLTIVPVVLAVQLIEVPTVLATPVIVLLIAGAVVVAILDTRSAVQQIGSEMVCAIPSATAPITVAVPVPALLKKFDIAAIVDPLFCLTIIAFVFVKVNKTKNYK
jgi:hypothetical protein